MGVVSITRLYDLLTIKVGRETAENLTCFIEEKIKEESNNRNLGLATKEDLSNTKADTIKWMFIFWIGQMVATFGFISFFLKKIISFPRPIQLLYSA